MYLQNDIRRAEPRALFPLQGSKNEIRWRLYVELLLLDCISLTGLLILAEGFFQNSWFSRDALNLVAMVVPIYLGAAVNSNAYSLRALTQPLQAAVKSALNIGLTMLAVLCVLYFAHVSDSVARLPFAVGILCSAIVLPALRKPFSLHALGRANGKLTNELIISDGVPRHRLPQTDILDADLHKLVPDLADPYMLNRLGRWLRSFDRVVVACPAERRSAWTIVLQGAAVQGEIMLMDDSNAGVLGIGRCFDNDTHIVSKGPLNMSDRLQKRLFDLAVTGPALLLLSPLFILVAIAIKLESPGPVLFFQDRIGLGNRLFKIAKFRSMRVESSDHGGSRSASRSDDRITRVGRIIRRTSIDELPQLFNVLVGDMSIVGPRPHALASTADHKLFWEVSRNYWRRHALKPGMTGLAQIRGFRGATERVEDLENRLMADLEYLRDWSLLHEIMIILKTFKVLIHKNAY
ncbi:sugar transferase [Sphingobium mellinum]|uniref:sugar transferase n=1 Tax=Sphingobium mellinum TaxID=1387166 RepID=UPI0030ED97AA